MSRRDRVMAKIDKNHWQVFPILDQIQNLEDIGGPERVEYIQILEVVKKDIEQRIASAKAIIAQAVKDGEMVCSTCGEEASWGGCDNGVCPDNALIRKK